MSQAAHKGFTLIEPILILAILGILFGLSTPYLLGYKEKLILQNNQDKIVNSLKNQQQKAIAAYKGYDYGITFNPPSNYILNPQGEINILHSKIRIDSVFPNTITFKRLTGKLIDDGVNGFNLVLHSNRFKCEINVSEEGVITTTRPERI